MELSPQPSHDSVMNNSVTDLRRLHGQPVLVISARDQGNPPAGRRGTIEVIEAPAVGEFLVRVIVEFPDMSTVPAHTQTIPVDASSLEQRLTMATSGTYELVIDGELG